MLPEIIGGRFKLLRELGHGGMGVVYLAEEEDLDRKVALKVLSTRRFSESALRHFEQEFCTLTSLSHPNLTEVYDFGRVNLAEGDRQVPFFTMEFVDGKTLDQYLSPGSGDLSGLLECLAQTGQALAYLHGRGLIHQDIKPSNILVAPGEDASPRVKLMDLGLAARPGEGAGSGSIRGTASYLAPEVARGGLVDPRSDLYSLGCVAYEMVAGRTPFQGTSALGILRGHLEEEPLPPSSLHRDLPPDLEKLILSLLAKDPGLRPSSADRFLGELNRVADGKLRIETAEVRRHRVLGPGFVGRDTERKLLDGFLDEAQKGLGRLILLVGEAGVGKSRLLREFQVRCQVEGLDVFISRAGAGRHATAGGLAEALERALRSRGPLSEETLSRHGAALRAFLGPMEESGEVREPEKLPGAEERYPLRVAVTAVIEELTRQGPMILALEDLHRADETTCALLSHLAGTLAPGGDGKSATLPLLLVGTYRADEVSRFSPLFDLLAHARDEGAIEEIFLNPLGPEETARMLRAMLGSGELPPLFVQRILEETRGNPLHMMELVAMLAEEGHLEPGADTPPDPEILSRVELPGRIRDLIERRLSRLEEGPLGLLQAAAVLGETSIDPDAVAGITGMKWERVVRLLLELHRSGLVQREEDEAGTPVYHMALPALAALAGESTSPEDARNLHTGAVSYLERRGIPRRHAAWAALAQHAEAAGRPGRAIEAYGKAGELAQELHAHREAIELFGRAIELVLRQDQGPATVLCGLYAHRGASYSRVGDLQRAEEDYRWMLARAEKAGQDELRARAHLDLGEVLSAGSRYGEAQENLEIAVEIASRLKDDALAARVLIGLGTVVSKLGHFDEGVSRLDRACARARRSGSRLLEAEAMLAKGMLYREQGNYRLSLECFREAAERTGGDAPPAVEEAIQEGSALALEVQGNHREAIIAYSEARDRAAERGDVRALASLSTSLGTTYMKMGEYEKASQELEESLAMQRRLGSREGMIVSQQGLATLQVHLGRYEPALEAAHEALRLARRIDKKDLVATSLNLIGRIHLRMGDLEGSSGLLEEAQRIMRDIRSPRWLALFLVDLGDLRRIEGSAELARRHYQECAFLARKVGDRRLESVAMSRLGEAHLLDNNYDRARVSCRKALELVEGSGLPREQADALLLRARIELSRPGGDVVRAEMDALTALERYRGLSEPEQIWQAEHLVARAAMRLGRRDEAASRIDRAHRYLEAVRSRLASRWKMSFITDPRRSELYEDWEELSKSAPHGETAPEMGETVGGDYARLQREVASLKRLLELNRTLNSTQDTDALLELILDAALELSGAERGFLLLQDGAEFTTRQARGAEGASLEGDDLALSRSIALKTMESGEPLLSTDAEADERFSRFESVRDLKIRSVLAVPLRIKDHVAGAIYLDHRLDRRIFTPTHLELASRLADQAGLALDNARLVSQIQEQSNHLERLNRELESTVQAQRTELASAREELSFTRSSLELRYRFEDLVGASRTMQKLYHLIDRLAPKKLPVLVTGESGTGKELIARALHSKSDRAGGPFFTVNCAALTPSLLESELFGFRKGAFTGADRDKPGYFELAHGGTLFLDEIGEMGQEMQAKLLRALERGEVLPVGGKKAVTVDVRIVSATNRDMESMVKEGSFREDLFYRINVARIHVPPLRDHLEDIPLLVDHFLALLAQEEKEPKREIEPAALKRLGSHAWPGNVRELQHRILRVATFSKGSTLTLKDFLRYGDLPTAATPAAGLADDGRLESLEEMERRQILLALEKASRNKTRAAELLGINRATLFRKLKRLGIQKG